MTQEDQENYRCAKNCWFCEKDIYSNRDKDHCQLTGKFRGPAHEICIINVKQKKVVLFLSSFIISAIMIVIYSPKNTLTRKKIL